MLAGKHGVGTDARPPQNHHRPLRVLVFDGCNFLGHESLRYFLQVSVEVSRVCPVFCLVSYLEWKGLMSIMMFFLSPYPLFFFFTFSVSLYLLLFFPSLFSHLPSHFPSLRCFVLYSFTFKSRWTFFYITPNYAI